MRGWRKEGSRRETIIKSGDERWGRKIENYDAQDKAPERRD